MEISISRLSEFGLVKMLDDFQSSVICLNIDGGPCYLVAPKFKKFKEIKERRPMYPCFDISGENFENLNKALNYYGYSLIQIKKS